MEYSVKCALEIYTAEYGLNNRKMKKCKINNEFYFCFLGLSVCLWVRVFFLCVVCVCVCVCVVGGCARA